ncbi:hypothetical protein BAU01nite_24740 [Brevibacterium aurantiacum]|nr:hypothetical protein BAU01nite_24740 [Brevibacterium aurantiacum]
MDDDEVAVFVHVDVDLDHVRTLIDAGDEGGDRILGMLLGRSSVSDDQRGNTGVGDFGGGLVQESDWHGEDSSGVAAQSDGERPVAQFVADQTKQPEQGQDDDWVDVT